MLPLLPALILLILQGPANLDAVQSQAAHKPALQALQGLKQDQATKEALARAVEKSPALAFAFAQLFGIDITEQPELKAPAEESAEGARECFKDLPPPPIPEGFLDCRRSRDGP